MSTELIKAISGLWPLALIIFLIICVVIFNKQIAYLLNRLAKIHFRKGDTEFTIERQDEKKATDNSQPKGLLEEGDQPNISNLPPITEENELAYLNTISKEDLPFELLSAFFENNLDKAEEIFNKIQSIEKDQIKRFQNEAHYLYRRFSKGDTEALAKLKNLEGETKPYPAANSTTLYYIGMCYESVSQFESAISIFTQSASLAQEEPIKADRLVEIANSYYSFGKKENAYNVLEEGIQLLSNPEALTRLYLNLADLYKKDEYKKMRAIALCKALDFQPNSTSIMFNTAYSYAESGFRDLSLYLYKTLINFSPDHKEGLNNLGVVYDELQMPIHSIKAYKKSWEQKETLAAANLAYRYLNAGFFDEAKNILSEVKKETDIHPNVANAISDLSKREEGEDKNEQEYLDRAIKQQQFLSKFAENYFKKVSVDVEIDGSWIIDDKNTEILQTGFQVTGTWEEDGNKKRFSGTLKNLGAVLEFEKQGYNFINKEKSFAYYGQGYAYLSADLQKLFVMILKDKDKEFITFSRNNQNEVTVDVIN